MQIFIKPLHVLNRSVGRQVYLEEPRELNNFNTVRLKGRKVYQ